VTARGRAVLASLLTVSSLAACSPDSAPEGTPAQPGREIPPSPQSHPGAESRGTRPGPIPRRARALAEDLARTERRLDEQIDEWLDTGGSLRSPRAKIIARDALRQQKIYRILAGDRRLARRVVARLGRARAPRVARHVRVARAVRAGIEPLKPPIKLKTKRAASPHLLRKLFESAQRRYAIHWTVLAAINFVESRFGRLPGPSSAGALGPMQFLPSTWARYGRGGNIRDPRDAIPAAARLLVDRGGRQRIRTALLAYNPSDAYVDAVLTYASEMRRDPRTYYAYYFWQVFVATTRGDKQLTSFER
jgi:soluble lytic murein transglycosylase-like protein